MQNYFSPSLYVGQFPHGLYALPSLIDNSKTATLAAPPKILLIEGPKNITPLLPNEEGDAVEISNEDRTPNTNPFEILLGKK